MSNKVEEKTMKPGALEPTLRFPEFREAGEWEEKEIFELCASDLSNGVFNDPKKFGTGYKLINVLDMYIDTAINEETLSLVDISRDEFLKNKVENGDIFFTRSSLVKSGIAYSNIYLGNSNDITFDGHLIRFKPDRKTIEPVFSNYLLRTYRVRIQLVARGKTATMTTIGQADVGSVKLPFPHISEQQKIADCLSSLDELITAQAQKLDTIKTHKKGLMQQLFPAEGETVPTLRFQEFSDEWTVHKIGDFIESYKGGAALTPSDFESYSTFEVIPKKAISHSAWLRINIEKPIYCNEEFFKKNPQSVVDSTYLITTLRDLVPSGPSIGYIVKYEGNKKYILAQGVYGLKPKKTIIADFLIYFSNTDIYRKMMNSAMVGSTQVHIRNNVYLSLPISVPLLEEQQKIADCLSSLDDLITAQTQKLATLKTHKKGLMQQLFPVADEVSS